MIFGYAGWTRTGLFVRGLGLSMGEWGEVARRWNAGETRLIAGGGTGASGKNPRGSMGYDFSGRRGLKAFTLGCGHVH